MFGEQNKIYTWKCLFCYIMYHVTYDVIMTYFMLKPKPRVLQFRMMAQIKAWCLENKMKLTRKFFAYTFNANSRFTSRDEPWLLRKVSWLWKKAIFLLKPKNWLPSEGRSDSLYYILKKTDIKFGRGDCEWRVCSILSTQYPYLGLKRNIAFFRVKILFEAIMIHHVM